MEHTNPPTRRNFLKTATALGAVGALGGSTAAAEAPDSRRLKIGLVGCGGRGTGAASDSMKADSNVELFAVADVSQGAIDASLRELKIEFKDRINVDPSRQFTGMDAWQKVMSSEVDLVILATPPGFRPIHFEGAVAAGKHIFCEKPMAVDVPGAKKVIAAARIAKEKKQAVVAGFCWRRCTPVLATMEKIKNGAIGQISSYYATYYTNPVKPMAQASSRKPEWSDVEWQIRNWYNFSWLCGDGLVEQAVHSVDKIGWAMGDKDPISCVGVGGRQVASEGGNIYDHFGVIYEFPDQVFCTMASRQQNGCDNENADYIHGTNGSCVLKGLTGVITAGGERWRSPKEEDNGMYVNEHIELYKSIRAGEPVNDGEWMVHSTLLAIMGRMAAYTGKKITWDMLMKSTEDLAPDDLKWDSSFMPTPMPIPGVTKYS